MMDITRITIDPNICHGKPCIRQMRWPVEVILDMLSSGMSVHEILADHPELESEDIQACLKSKFSQSLSMKSEFPEFKNEQNKIILKILKFSKF